MNAECEFITSLISIVIGSQFASTSSDVAANFLGICHENRNEELSNENI
jgi:hypothetical protein